MLYAYTKNTQIYSCPSNGNNKISYTYNISDSITDPSCMLNGSAATCTSGPRSLAGIPSVALTPIFLDAVGDTDPNQALFFITAPGTYYTASPTGAIY